LNSGNLALTAGAHFKAEIGGTAAGQYDQVNVTGTTAESVDFNDMRVICDGQGIKLTRKEFTLLEYLIKNTGRVATRQQLLDNVWGYSYFGDTRTLDVHIRRLRQKMDECGGCIETVVGVGYRFNKFK